MPIERISRPGPTPPSTQADMTRAILRFAAIEAVGVIALAVFLMGYFNLGWFPAEDPRLLITAIAAFAIYVGFALWASGLLATFRTGRTDAGR